MSKHWDKQWAEKRSLVRDGTPDDFRNTRLVRCIEPHASAQNIAALMERCDGIGVPRELRRDTLAGDPPSKIRVLRDVAKPITPGNHMWVTAVSLRHAYFAHSVFSHYRGPQRPITVLEIGPGFGGLAEMLTRGLEIERYVFVDDRVCLDMQKRFMSLTCPALECLFLRPSDEWSRTPDLVVNTHSFVEMDPLDVAGYFARIHSALQEGGALYSVNLRRWDISCFPMFPFDRRWRHELLRKSKYAPAYVESLSVRDYSADSPHPDTLL